MGDVLPVKLTQLQPPSRARVWLRALIRLFVYALMLKGAEWALYEGVNLRYTAWEDSKNIRFTISLFNAQTYGRYTNDKGILRIYDDIVERYTRDGNFLGGTEPGAQIELDYPPLRLLIAAGWAKWGAWYRGDVDIRRAKAMQAAGIPLNEGSFLEMPPGFQGLPIPMGRGAMARNWYAEQYYFNMPMLWLNGACELAAAIGMFFLVRYWVRTCRPAPQWYHGLAPGYVAAMLLWFNPAVIFNAHVFPQWDVWILPAFVWGAYLCLRNWWMPAGLLIGVSCLAKGQILMVAPAFILWPLFQLRFGAILRLACGFSFGAALVVWPWLLSKPESYPWLYRVAGGLALLLGAFAIRRLKWWWRLPLALAGAALVFPWMLRDSTGKRWLDWKLVGELSLGAAALAAWAMFANKRNIVSGVVGTASAAAFACTPLFGASDAWYRVGILFGTEHWKTLAWMWPSNLGSILFTRRAFLGQSYYQWAFRETYDLNLFNPWGNGKWVVEMRSTMIALYAIGLVLSGIAMAAHHRRKDRRFLFALVAPWILMFAFMPQMQDRYLVWAAGATCAVAVLSFPGLLLCAAVTAASWAMMAYCVMTARRMTPEAIGWMPKLEPIYPHMGWGIMLLAVAALGIGLARARRRPRLAPVAEATPAVRPTEPEPPLSVQETVMPLEDGLAVY